MFVVTSNQMRQAELNAVKRGVSFRELMEKAGTACAEIIQKHFNITRDAPKNILVLCGKGKNGGDGFVIARKAAEYGCKTTVALVCGEPRAKQAADMFALLDKTQIEVIRIDESPLELEKAVNEADIIVEAVFGVGFKGSLDASLSRLSGAVEASGAKLVCVDVPAGVDCDAASVRGAAFKAYMTIAISAYKPVHIIKPCNRYCGRLALADVGVTDEDFRKIDSVVCFTLDSNDIKNLLPKRKPVSNKGTYGHALCVCGSVKMTGAAYLSVSGALRCGVGLVTAAFPREAYCAIAPKLTEPLLLPLETNFEGTFAYAAAADVIDASKRASAVLVGCGIGYNEDSEKLMKTLVRELKIPTVIDADGINALSSNIDILKEARAPIILTPHPGEMSRICGKTIAQVVENPIGTAYNFAKEYGVTVALKTTNTIVCGGSPTRIYVNATGNSGLAKGGSGDLLAGMTVSFLAQGSSPFNSAVSAVYLHGLCADVAARRTSARGMTPSDVLNYLPRLFSKFE